MSSLISSPSIAVSFGNRISSITMDNVEDIFNRVHLLKACLSQDNSGIYDHSTVYVRCLMKLISLEVKDFFSLFHECLNKVRSLVNSIRSSVQLKDIFESVATDLNSNHKLSFVYAVDVKTRWSSIFEMTWKCFTLKRIFKMETERIPELCEHCSGQTE